MKATKKPASPINRENKPVVTSISKTEWVTTYPNGMVVESAISRPNTEADLLWLYQMVSTLVPQFKANDQLKK